MKKIQFCQPMKDAIEAPEVPISYIEKYLEAGILVLDGGSSKITMQYCPWCGNKLPDSLRDKWFDTLENLSIDPISEEIPEEFQDVRWIDKYL